MAAKRRGLFQHYRANHPSPLNEFLRDLTRPGYVKGAPHAVLPSKPRTATEIRANQRAFGIVFLLGGLIELPLYVAWMVDFNWRLLDTLGWAYSATVIGVISALGAIMLWASRKRR